MSPSYTNSTCRGALSRRREAWRIGRLERGHQRESQVAFALFRFEVEGLCLLLFEDAPLDFVDPVFAEHVFARDVGAPKIDFDARVALERELALGLRRRGGVRFCCLYRWLDV